MITENVIYYSDESFLSYVLHSPEKIISYLTSVVLLVVCIYIIYVLLKQYYIYHKYSFHKIVANPYYKIVRLNKINSLCAPDFKCDNNCRRMGDKVYLLNIHKKNLIHLSDLDTFLKLGYSFEEVVFFDKNYIEMVNDGYVFKKRIKLRSLDNIFKSIKALANTK